MNEEERERTMNFILEQQAQVAAGMQKFEEGMQRLRRDLALMAVQFRRERKDLRERVSALVDSHVRASDRLAESDARLSRIEALTERNSEDIRRNSEDIRALTNYVARDDRKQNGGADEG